MDVKPQIQEFLGKVEQLKAYLASINFKPNQTNTREALANMTRLHVTNYNLQLFAIDDVVMNSNYPVPVRIYHPKPGTALPVAVFIHGGGHMCGSITVYDGIVRNLTEKINHIVISVDYRLSPEFAYPTGLEDCKKVIQNVFDVLEQRQIAYSNRDDLTIIGDSGGAALCSTIAMDESFVKQNHITKQILIYPSVDYTLTNPTIDKFGTGYLLDKTKIAWYFDNYFQNNEDRQAKSPLYGNFYSSMPTTLVIVASHDPLSGEGIAYAHKVQQVSAESQLLTVNGVVHAYLMLENLCPEECAQTYNAIANFLTK